MILPLRTDRRLIHMPWVNLFLIALNLLIFLLQTRSMMRGNLWWEPLLLDPTQPHWYQFFTYQFLHFDWLHVLGNMLFLYVFGNSVEDRFGPLGYLFFYLAGGVVAGLGYSLMDPHPLMGASGSVAAVTGAFLALFPQTRVLLLVFIYVFEVASIWFLLLWFVKDLAFELLGSGGRVAHVAHLSANIFGFVVGMALLASRLLPREPYDLLAMVQHWNRRREFRAIMRDSQSPWRADAARESATLALSPQEQMLRDLRAEVSHHLHRHEAQEAIAAYNRLLELDPTQVLDRDRQVDVASVAMKIGAYDLAARAYELFLHRYAEDDLSSEVRLLLGLIYGRYLDDPLRAREHLQAAREQLSQGPRRDQADALLAELEPGVGPRGSVG